MVSNHPLFKGDSSPTYSLSFLEVGVFSPKTIKESEEISMSIDEMISKLDGACGRMLTVVMQNPVIREAMEMVTEVSIALGEMAEEMEDE